MNVRIAHTSASKASNFISQSLQSHFITTPHLLRTEAGESTQFGLLAVAAAMVSALKAATLAFKAAASAFKAAVAALKAAVAAFKLSLDASCGRLIASGGSSVLGD